MPNKTIKDVYGDSNEYTREELAALTKFNPSDFAIGASYRFAERLYTNPDGVEYFQLRKRTIRQDRIQADLALFTGVINNVGPEGGATGAFAL